MKFYISERITVIAAFAMALFVQGAEQPNMDWREQAREAWRVGKKGGLTPDAVKQIQEYLVPQQKTIKIELANMTATYDLRLTFEDLSSGKPVGFVPQLQIDIASRSWDDRLPRERVLNIPIVPMKITVREIDGREEAGLDQNGLILFLAEGPKSFDLGSVTVTAEDLTRIKSLIFASQAVIFVYSDGKEVWVSYEK
jgi:hypothetical protein